ncbi:hypothetical protein JIG36_10665 [Actinoplanes sp. LDG1-06]|uniref:Uncharacterized protein n=1 Tax=Paractinoplanes ovalisporus TaxID=2810368 RepID=A0ABS2A875_9ACTN|nr:hypothetical protein [Actinoplanes ovalisporus]MBM2616018.1 hypothetical protein [Actinoplanes ovalisporus]
MDTVGTLLTRLIGDRSVTAVAARAHIWPGRLRKWMSGAAVPSTSTPLTAVGNVCGANEWQLGELVDAWYVQTHPPIELRHGGFVFHDDRRAAPGVRPDDLCNAALHAVWRRTGQLFPDPGQDFRGAVRALRDWQLGRLVADDELREEIRRELAPEAPRSADPDALERRIGAEIAVGYEQGRSRRALDLIGAGLLHPDEGMRSRARELLTTTPPPPLDEAERQAVLATAAGGTTPEWAHAVAPADREVVEHGIRECYRLAGLDGPESIVWVDSPYTGVLLRRLAEPLYDTTLWSRNDRIRDVETVTIRYADDLRLRMQRELNHLLGRQGHDPAPRGPLAPLSQQLRLTGRPDLVATDPQRARQALVEAAARLPGPRPALGDGDPLPADNNDRYFHLGGQGVASWIGESSRLVEGLQAAGAPLGDLPSRLAAYRDANTAGPWWPGSRLVIVSERPVSIDPGPVRWTDGTTFGN